jgi:hypothetical protein
MRWREAVFKTTNKRISKRRRRKGIKYKNKIINKKLRNCQHIKAVVFWVAIGSLQAKM